MNIIDVTAENKNRVRAYYFSLCEQGKANFLYDNLIGGGRLGLRPDEYPKCPPLHRQCSCGSEPELHDNYNSVSREDCYVACKNCGCRAKGGRMPLDAWRAWDTMQLTGDENNMTLWEFL